MTSLEKDLAFMKEPRGWPNWPLLPLKRRDQNFHRDDYCGFLFSDGTTMVYVGTIFEVVRNPSQSWGEALGKFEKRTYADLASLAEEWTVD